MLKPRSAEVGRVVEKNHTYCEEMATQAQKINDSCAAYSLQLEPMYRFSEKGETPMPGWALAFLYCCVERRGNGISRSSARCEQHCHGALYRDGHAVMVLYSCNIGPSTGPGANRHISCEEIPSPSMAVSAFFADFFVRF